ncbi:MAG: preprotein translocase subunit YidC [Hyphomonadaceae bacterium]|nr:MAG: preprotein translocase subunit YidC [Hyphomonadaceae bacterium]KAF0187067.1 MAG: preprotein translocase subunit YidC [Hyphomonadaceae bacterium]
MQPNQQQPDTKNFLIAIIISLAILFGFQTFWVEPQSKALLAQQKAASPAAPTTPSTNSALPAAPAATSAPVSRTQALALSQRITIETSKVKGSLSTFGGRLDDINLKDHRLTIDPNSPNIELLSPQASGRGYFAFFGWAADGYTGAIPGPDSIWNLVSGTALAPNSPIVLEFDNGQGLKFSRKIEVDNEYLFTYTDTVTNTSAAAVNLKPYGAVRRYYAPEIIKGAASYEGAVGILDGKLTRLRYREMDKGKANQTTSHGGWLGFSDTYWLVALIPNQNETIQTNYKSMGAAGGQSYETSFVGQGTVIAPGQSTTHTERVYAGSKKVAELNHYQETLGLDRFDNAVDWGVLWFLSKPVYWLMLFFTSKIGNIGLAMLAMTVVVKTVTFPLVYQSYKSFAKLRDLGPKMKELQEKYANDKERSQQEMIKLYQVEKINPVAGCIPMLLQMPIFLALFKVLSISLELRHAPFYGWIDDLSAKDPTSLFNLFGLLPFDPTAIPLIGVMLGIGAWPLMYGVSMWLLQKMQPTATDPVQARVFALMPWMFAVIFASFSSGLVIYYTWSNLLTIVQQYVIAKRSGNSNPIDEFFAKLGKPKAAAE